ncbi:rhodanese-like domain-containing protein [Desulfosarcina sp.]|uniref:rhodanese-like domain-containing protein n=1 Tax=Desulfosarcina sp. TaxID=2027861 RepID=UPI0035647A9E
MFKLAAKEALILIGAAVAVALAVYAVRPDKIGITPAAVNQDALQQSATERGFSEISLEDAVRLYQEKRALFADARHAADFVAGHIKGAVNLYTADQEIWLAEFLADTDPTVVIIAYCDGENCHLAPALAELLFFNGFGNVRYLKNGWSRWREGGYPVE